MIDGKDRAKMNQMQNDYEKTFLRTKSGRRVLKDILAKTGVFELSFSSDSDRVTSMNEGKREIGLTILEALDKKTYEGLRELEEQGATDTDIFTER